MRVLVTGAAGFIGSNFVHLVMRERPDWSVTALDLLTYAGNLENLADFTGNPRFSFVKIDIADQQAVHSLFESSKFDIVFHFAAESHVDRSNYGAADFVRTNVLGTENLLSAARAHETGRFVHISTDEVYGSLASGSFTESSPLNPTNPYAASKAGSDLMVLAAFKTHGMNALITRCTNNYGAYQFPEKLIPLFITNALEDRKLPLYGDGLNVRSWIHVSDHCRGVLLAGERGRAGEVYNIGCGPDSELTNKEMTARILKLLGKPESLIERVADRPAHDRRYSVDWGKINKELGWKPLIGIEEGLAQTVDWYKANTEWWNRVKSGAYRNYYEMHYGRRSRLELVEEQG